MANAVRRNRRDEYNQNLNRAYVDGNTVRKVQAVPAPVQKPQVSKKARKNRAKATSMSLGFVAFLVITCGAILFFGVNYLQMKAQLTSQTRVLSSLETEYNELKADNDAYYSQVSSSANLDNIKAIAIKRLGMKYATEEQVITYETERSSYVKQYQDVPAAK